EAGAAGGRAPTDGDAEGVADGAEGVGAAAAGAGDGDRRLRRRGIAVARRAARGDALSDDERQARSRRGSRRSAEAGGGGRQRVADADLVDREVSKSRNAGGVGV